ncbi:MAG: DUF3489 domain-containing protein [Gammaproteobacteria bacterium]|nr:MAG: DUF3489 domain-containing protein [Gammaproteobacteria bacterium]
MVVALYGVPLMTDTDTKRARKMAREPKVNETDAVLPKQQSKISVVLGLLQRHEGATIDQLVVATGWLPHTTRAALTGLKQKGHAVTSDKVEGRGRIYRVLAP